MNQVPLDQVPTQTTAVTLDGQAAQIELRQNAGNMFLSLRLGTNYVLRSKICRDRQNMLVGLEYRGFRGALMFVDTQGVEDPFYAELSTRFLLVFIPDAEL